MNKTRKLQIIKVFRNTNSLQVLICLLFAVILLSGCLIKNDSQDVIKITSENSTENKFIKVNKTLSLKTGINLIESGELDNAIKFFKEYEDFYLKNPKYYYYLGEAYYKKGLYKEAYTGYKKSLSLDRDRYDLFLNIAQSYEKAGLKKIASENYANYVFNAENPSKAIELRNKLNKISEPELGIGVVGRISLSDRADAIKNSAIGFMQAFSPETSVIFASIELIEAKKPDKIRINWYYINSKKEIIDVNHSEFSVSGTKTVLVSIKNPVSGWPAGKYEMQILVNGIKNTSIKFYIF